MQSEPEHQPNLPDRTVSKGNARPVKRGFQWLLALGGFLLGLLLVEVLCRLFNLYIPPMLLAVEDTPGDYRKANHVRLLEAAGAPSDGKLPFRRHQPLFAEENCRRAMQGVPLKDLGYHTSYTVANGTNGVIILGDSFAQAVHIREEEGFAERLKQSLAPLPVVNLGLAGTGLENMAYQLRSFAAVLKPKLVVCALFADDLRRQRPDWFLVRNRPVGCLRAGQLTYLPASEAVEHPFLYYNSRIYQADNYLLRKPREQWMSNFLRFGSIYRLNEALLRDMKSVCQQNKAQFMVMFIPSRRGLEASALLSSITRPAALYELCRLYQIPLLDLSASLHEKPSSFYLAGDTHFNGEGHRVAFAQLNQFLSEHRLLETRSE